jgi:hypothetical protein
LFAPSSEAAGLDQNVEHFALGIQGPPELDQATIDLEINLVEMPDGMRLRPAVAKIGRDHRSEVFHPFHVLPRPLEPAKC